MKLGSQAKWNTFLHLFFHPGILFENVQGTFRVKSSDTVSLKYFAAPVLPMSLTVPLFLWLSPFFLTQRGNRPDLVQQVTLGKIMLWPLGHLFTGVCVFTAVSRASFIPCRRNPSSAAVDSFRVLEQSTANELPVNAPSMLMTVSKGTSDKVIFNRMSSVSEY